MLFQEMEAFGRSSGSAVGGGGPFSRMQQQMAALQQQISAMSHVNEMGPAPPGYRPAPRHRKAAASEVFVIDSDDEY